MALWIMSSVAVIATAGCFVLWFRDVRRIMREGASTVESARRQLVFWQKRASAAPGDPEAEGVLERSEWIYRQAVENYNRTMRKLSTFLPAYLMGFRIISMGTSEVSFDKREPPLSAQTGRTIPIDDTVTEEESMNIYSEVREE